LPYQCHAKIKTKTEMYKSGAKERAATGGWLGNGRKMGENREKLRLGAGTHVPLHFRCF